MNHHDCNDENLSPEYYHLNESNTQGMAAVQIFPLLRDRVLFLPPEISRPGGEILAWGLFTKESLLYSLSSHHQEHQMYGSTMFFFFNYFSIFFKHLSWFVYNSKTVAFSIDMWRTRSVITHYKGGACLASAERSIYFWPLTVYKNVTGPFSRGALNNW